MDGMMSQGMQQGMGGMPMQAARMQQMAAAYGGMPNMMMRPTGNQQFPVVRLRGLPFECGEGDVCEFFQGLDPIDVVMCRNKSGRMSGEAYVVFPGAVQVEQALTRNGHHMGKRYIEVFNAKKGEYYGAIAAQVALLGEPQEYGHAEYMQGNFMAYNGQQQQMPDAGFGGAGMYQAAAAAGPAPQAAQGGASGMGATSTYEGLALLLRGLPFACSKDDIVNFFDVTGELGSDPLPIQPITHERIVHPVLGRDGRSKGMAYVIFNNPEEVQQAMKRDRKVIGSRYIELLTPTRQHYTELDMNIQQAC
mmetsp:Transcript_17406/g.20892  ORF Transcript_17406/g.20892 Transcript_17406/m.20892 type:complete len:306 (+) Transcript_17406:218-1135(+)